MEESAGDNAIRRFVRELDALQRAKGDRVILEELVEAMGRTEITAAGVAEVIRGVEREGIASWSTVPNPQDSNRRKILLWLNREHPVVQAALGGEPIPRKPPCTERPEFPLPIGTVKGEPLSETLIRKRR